MRSYATGLLGFTFLVLLCVRCHRSTNPAVGRSLARLGEIIELPVRPQEVWFGTVDRFGESWVPGPTDAIFVAVMRFDPKLLSRFVDGAKSDERPPTPIRKSAIPTWIPAEVKDALVEVDDRNYRVKGKRFVGSSFNVKQASRDAGGGDGTFIVLDEGRFVVLWKPM